MPEETVYVDELPEWINWVEWLREPIYGKDNEIIGFIDRGVGKRFLRTSK